MELLIALSGSRLFRYKNSFQKSKKPFEVIYKTGGLDESFHILIDIENDVITRWGVFENVTQELLGSPGEGTSIDFDEPFVLRFECDEDGWILMINEDHKYQTFFHLFSPDLVETVQLQGQADISYVGFGAAGCISEVFKTSSHSNSNSPQI